MGSTPSCGTAFSNSSCSSRASSRIAASPSAGRWPRPLLPGGGRGGGRLGAAGRLRPRLLAPLAAAQRGGAVRGGGRAR